MYREFDFESQTETPKKTEVQASSFGGISFGVDQDTRK